MRRPWPRTPPSAEAEAFVEDCYRRLLARPADRAGLRTHTRFLGRGGSRGELILGIAQSEEYVEHTARAVDLRPDKADRAFVEAAYRELLGREPDPGGLANFADALATGASRLEVARQLARSDEHVNRIVSELFPIQNLIELRPERYHTVRANDADKSFLAFQAEEPEDFDWLEAAILGHGYYDKPGVWGFSINTDKQVMAEIVAAFRPRLGLEIGCANGTVLQCLHEQGLVCEGVEISHAVIQRAFPDVRNRIHEGDLIGLQLQCRYDVIFGLDIFEHLNPNRLPAYLAKVAQLLVPEGFVFANIPAFGKDPVFGEVFNVYLDEWEADRRGNTNFATLLVDDDGYPLHGHLVWADTSWWEGQFAAAGLFRVPEIEQALHDQYDEFLTWAAPARRSFYVFAREPRPEPVSHVIERIAANGSAVLAGLRAQPDAVDQEGSSTRLT